MIVTSNTVTHNIHSSSLRTIGQVDNHLDVVEGVIVTINSQIEFTRTESGGPGIGTTTVQEIRTASTNFLVDVNTVGIATTSFVGFSSLTEDTVLGWASTYITPKRNELESRLLTIKDGYINPKKYQHITVVSPWL